MLNELYSLSTALQGKGISTKEWHREYNPLPKVTTKAPCIRIWLAADGSVCGIEHISAELAQSLRKFGNNQNSFPAFNIAPLYRIIDIAQIDELKHIEKEPIAVDLEKVKSWCVNDNWKDSLVRKVDNSMHTYSHKLLETIGRQEQREYQLISELTRLSDAFSKKMKEAKQVEQSKTIADTFRSTLEKCVFTMLKKQEDINLALTLLFHKGDSKKDPQNDDGTLSVILDLFDWQQYGHPVASKSTTEWINEMLLKSSLASVTTLSESDESDAFGMPFINPNEPMPSVRLSGFDVILRSMFHGQPCQARYGQIDDGSYPIAKVSRSHAKKALEWVASQEKEGVTWQKVDAKEIVFAYPSKLPAVSPKFASIFGSNQIVNSVQTEARFGNVAKEFIKALSGIPACEKPEYIRIFTIRKIDKARSKVVFSQNCSPEQLIVAAEKWEVGYNNTPENDLGETNLFPLQVARIVNNVWKKNGELAQGKSSVERMKCYQGMELLLNIMQKSMICNYLHIVLVNSSGLVNYFGNWVHGGAKCKDTTERKNLEKMKKEIILLLAVFGVLLDKNNDRKEKYMENMAYLVGQLLKISDELHALYCKVVRSGDVPPQLAGSALFVTAGETPYQAITQLSLRMNPYITWAKQHRFKNIQDAGKKSSTAAWYLKLYEEVADKLRLTMNDSKRFNDFEKAQLFIGYLASFPKSEPMVNFTDKNNNNNIIGGSDNE